MNSVTVTVSILAQGLFAIEMRINGVNTFLDESTSVFIMEIMIFFTFLRNKVAVHTYCYRSKAWQQNVYCMCRLTAVNQTTPVLDCILMQFSPSRTIALVSLTFHLTFYLHPQPRQELHKQKLKRYMIDRPRAHLKLRIVAAGLKRPLTSDTVS